MPTGKLLRLPEHWQEYQKKHSADYALDEDRIRISREESAQ
jgi:hypothetical protein